VNVNECGIFGAATPVSFVEVVALLLERTDIIIIIIIIVVIVSGVRLSLLVLRPLLA
jgi:hypothetical protein